MAGPGSTAGPGNTGGPGNTDAARRTARPGRGSGGDGDRRPLRGSRRPPPIGPAPRISPAPASHAGIRRDHAGAPASPAPPIRGAWPSGRARPSGGGSRTIRGRPAAPGRRPAPTVPPPGDSCTPARLSYPDELAAAALLATGILAALGRQRREQLWQRAFGRRVVAPAGRAALAESALRAGAHEPSARLLDRGLRYLSRALALEGRTPPAVVAAHLSHENLDLWVAPADLDAPAPWTAVGDGQVWRLPFTALGRVDVDEAARRPGPVPRPGLHRRRPHRAGSGEPGSGAWAHLRDRPAGHDHRGAVLDGHGAGHQPLVRPDAHHAGRLRRRPDPAGPRPDHRGAHRG